MYEVIKDFVDLQDFEHLYKTGDNFPRKGAKVSDGRITELLSFSNRSGEPLIREKKVINPKNQTLSDASAADTKPLTDDVQVYTKTEIARMSKADLVSLATKYGVDGANDMNGNALKQVLMDKLGL